MTPNSYTDFNQTHSDFDQVLKINVKEALVDYGALKTRRQSLDQYLVQVASVPEPEFKRWTEPQQLAFLLNAYNAYTLQLIIDHYPVKSIKDIGSFFKGPWDQPVVRLFGRTSISRPSSSGMGRTSKRRTAPSWPPCNLTGRRRAPAPSPKVVSRSVIRITTGH